MSKDYESPVFIYSAWGTALDAESQDNGYKAVTTAWTPGLIIPVFRRSEYVQFVVDCSTMGLTSKLYFMAEVGEKINGEFAPLCAGTAMVAVGGELHSDLLPFVRTYSAADNKKIAFTFTFKSRYVRLLVKGNLPGGLVQVQASL